MTSLFYAFTRNIGDDIQAIAACSLLGPITSIGLRDQIHEGSRDVREKGILNGWLSHGRHSTLDWKNLASTCPPASFHIAKEMHTSPDWLDYFRSSPFVLTRDIHTKNILAGKGIDSEFAGCMTLLISEMLTHSPTDTDNYYVCTEEWYLSEAIRLAAENGAQLYYLDPNKMPTSILLSLPARLSFASGWLKLLSKANLVFTDRIHTAFPAISLGRKVSFLRFIDSSDQAGYKDLPTGKITRLLGYESLLAQCQDSTKEAVEARQDFISSLTRPMVDSVRRWLSNNYTPNISLDDDIKVVHSGLAELFYSNVPYSLEFDLQRQQGLWAFADSLRCYDFFSTDSPKVQLDWLSQLYEEMPVCVPNAIPSRMNRAEDLYYPGSCRAFGV